MIGNKWDLILEDEFKKDYFKNLMDFVDHEYSIKTCFPQYNDIFNAFKMTDYDDVKVVILGQDPYHGEDEAHGLSFSVYNNIKNPPSLRNIFKELDSDLNISRLNSDLTSWASQGILLLNAILTVEKDKPLSHKKKGWEIFTDEVIKKISARKDKVIFVLWGGFAKGKKALIDDRHYIIECVHPSPLSAYHGFFGSKPFSKINDILKNDNKDLIDFSK